VLKLLQLIVVVAFTWSIGLGFYISAFPDRQDAERVIAAVGKQPDTGIAVLTGGGGKRIADAMQLFSNNVGERLLVSGVHRDTTHAAIKQFWTGDMARFTCCVDLGSEAKTTRGNAYEVAAWADQYGYSRLVIVTSDYHVLRAMREIRSRVMVDTLVALPTPSGYFSEAGWPQNLRALKIIVVEYSKYLAASLTTYLDRADR